MSKQMEELQARKQAWQEQVKRQNDLFAEEERKIREEERRKKQSEKENFLEDLKKEVQDKGVVTDMSQGAYSIKRANPALQTYNQLIKNYTNCIKQLYELLPKDVGNDTDEELDKFLED